LGEEQRRQMILQWKNKVSTDDTYIDDKYIWWCIQG
jgi:hypothetical protein